MVTITIIHLSKAPNPLVGTWTNVTQTPVYPDKKPYARVTQTQLTRTNGPAPQFNNEPLVDLGPGVVKHLLAQRDNLLISRTENRTCYATGYLFRSPVA